MQSAASNRIGAELRGLGINSWTKGASLISARSFTSQRTRGPFQKANPNGKKCSGALLPKRGAFIFRLHAAASPAAPTQDKQESWSRTFDIAAGDMLEATVSVDRDSGAQTITVRTDKAGSLLLHWGVEGGEGYSGGWRLPGASARPPATTQYKQRALQSRFLPEEDNAPWQRVRIVLTGDETSDRLNFVVKDDGAGAWYNLNGANFQLPLRKEAEPEEVKKSKDTATTTLLPADAVPVIPQELAGLWAYRSWERAGCPSRGAAEADAEYAGALNELVLALRRGTSLDELWAVARGEVAYDQFKKSGATGAVVEEAPPAPQQKEERKIPQDLINTEAYLLWEKAGRPDGADFGAQALKNLRELLAKGKTIADLRKTLITDPAEAEKRRKKASHVDLGAPRGPGRRIDPLRFVNPPAAAPLLTEPVTGETPLAPLIADASSDDRVVWSRTYNLGDNQQLLVAVRSNGVEEGSSPGPKEIELVSDCSAPLVLHWGVRPRDNNRDWCPPPAEVISASGASTLAGGGAAEVIFSTGPEEGSVQSMDDEELPLQRSRLFVPGGSNVAALTFVLRSADGSRWWRDGGGNFRVPLAGPGGMETAALPGALSVDAARLLSDPVGRAIVEAEESSAWTLMHRFNKASDLLTELMEGRFDDIDGSLARIFVWLRYSAIRQLTWQRNYNTQPRILGAAQERLTHTIARLYQKTAGDAREWARLLLTTVGRGGNAQAVRDEILHIMHRNHIPERAGTWMEQWHQKLHNNTTPDDVPICEAYLAFLRSNGDVGTYWRVLSEAGLGRSRLESFDRAITAEPQFYADKREALQRDFQHYLGILKAVHSGADLQASAAAAGWAVPGEVKGPLGYVLSHVQNDGTGVLALIQAAVEARTELAASNNALNSGNRDLLYLDLALEAAVRQAAERGASGPALIEPLLQNLALSTYDNAEICHCLKAWLALPEHLRAGARSLDRDEALQAMAVLDRTRRAVGGLSDRIVKTLAPLADALGTAFGAEAWTIRLFAEEVVRSGPAFAVSLALSATEPALRQAAELGAWQLVSPGTCVGTLEVEETLHAVQDKRYGRPTVLLAKRVSGEEEIPAGVVGLVSPNCPDVLSHLAVRARNLHVLLAACHEPEPLAEVEAAAGKTVELSSTAAGALNWEVLLNGSGSSDGNNGSTKNKVVSNPKIPKWCGRWAVPMSDYKPGVVGAKSKNLAGLRGRLPDTIQLPASVTIPFGSCEKALELRENKALAKELRAAVSSVTPDAPGPALARCRDLVNQISIPSQLRDQLEGGMRDAGIPVPGSEGRWEAAFRALKAVWASKYNDRAYYSCRKVGLRFDDIRMAVLCQRVVPAKYAFVIHTANPISGDKDEIYAELVIGLGESIVSGTVPGSALAFSARKEDTAAPSVLLYPSKSEGMRVVESLIFRSDSNGEDLEGYAGAGLYESVTLDPTTQERVDYSDDKIITDPAYRRSILSAICQAGLEIEQALGSAQDIEGVVGPDDVITIVQTRPQV